MNSLTTKQARKLVLASQGIHRESEFGEGNSGLKKAIERLGYIQIDTLSVVERAHHHTCWNRVKNYSVKLLEQAVARGDVFEYWSHAAAYLPMRDYRYSLPKKQLYLDGASHWYQKDSTEMAYVRDRIRAEGALKAKDFIQQRSPRNHAWGGQKPAKMALEQLFMQGDLMVSERRGFQKVFDLAERVLPDGIDQSMPSDDEYHDHLIISFLTANGLGSAAEISYLRKGLKSKIEIRCQHLVEDQRLRVLNVAGRVYFALSEFEDVLDKRVSTSKVKILSPFDNLLIQRQRMRDLFGFDYQVECYVNEQKRKHGYFVLPILCGQQFVGRMDAKIDRKTKVMTVSKLFFESEKQIGCLDGIRAALVEFLKFNQGQRCNVNRILLTYRSANDIECQSIEFDDIVFSG